MSKLKTMKDVFVGNLIWKAEEDQIKEFEEIKKTRDEVYGQDGKIVAAEGEFIYRGIAYLVKVLRYFNYREGFTTLGSARISQYHAVVEYPPKISPIVNLIPIDYNSDFLYHNTLHYWNDNQTTEQQVYVCHNLAMKDIDDLLDGQICKEIEKKIKELQKVKDKLENKRLKLKEKLKCQKETK